MITYIRKLIRFLSFANYSLKRRRQTDEHEQQEDFLKTLYESGGNLSVEQAYHAARALHITREQLARIIGTLLLQGELVKTDTLQLTPQGKTHALKLIRAHRIYEQYLAEHSGYAPVEWHERAHRMEHKISDDEQKRIVSLLGNPLFDPHGDPIPTQSLAIAPKEDAACPFKAQTWWRITHVEDDNETLFSLITEKGLTQNSIIFVTRIAPDAFTFVYEGETFTLPLEAQEAMNKVEISEEEARRSPETAACRLTRIAAGEERQIVGLSPSCRGALRRRLMDLGFVKGSSVSIDMKSPLGNPVAYVVRGTAIALRHDQARYILITNG